MKYPEEYIKDYMLDDLDGHMAFAIQEIQKETYNQAIEDILNEYDPHKKDNFYFRDRLYKIKIK